MSRIYDITPFTLLDYPDELAAIVWMSGCNLRCVYCHNPDIVLSRGRKSEQELFDLLERRKGRLTGVVFSGGEATFCPELPDLVRRVKQMGFKVKLDTNGSNPSVLRDLAGQGLLDYVALDYKAPAYSIAKVVGTSKFDADFQQSLDYLIAQSNDGRLMFEVRTTAAPEFLNEDDLSFIIEDLDRRGFRGRYFVQHVVSSGEKTLGNIAEPKASIDPDKLAKPTNFDLCFRNFPFQK